MGVEVSDADREKIAERHPDLPQDPLPGMPDPERTTRTQTFVVVAGSLIDFESITAVEPRDQVSSIVHLRGTRLIVAQPAAVLAALIKQLNGSRVVSVTVNQDTPAEQPEP